MNPKAQPIASPFIIPADKWKRTRDKLARQARRHMHVIEVNPGPSYHLRFDYIVTASEVTALVEEVMRETERQVAYAMRSGS